jgi:hypothetical protein
MDMKLIDLVGKRFGRLVVLKRVDDDKNKNRRWLCLCYCGKKKIVHGSSLYAGRTKSCGCLQKEIVRKLFTKHGHSKCAIYNIWASMNQRCINPNNKEYHNYGGRGINVCKRWRNSFPNFLKDMGERSNKKYTLERTNNNRGYCKSNCEWATSKQNSRNRRNNRPLTHNCKTQLLIEWAEETGIDRQTIATRIDRYGWSITKALTTPIRKKKNL